MKDMIGQIINAVVELLNKFLPLFGFKRLGKLEKDKEVRDGNDIIKKHIKNKRNKRGSNDN